MVISLKSEGIAAVEAASVLAATLASSGLRPVVQLVSPTSAQALALHALARQLDLEVVGAAGARAATWASPRIVAGRVGAGLAVASPGIVNLTCRDDACRAVGMGGWSFAYDGPNGRVIHCPPPPRTRETIAQDSQATAFAVDILGRHAVGILARQAGEADLAGFVPLGRVALAILGGLEGRSVEPSCATPTGGASRRPRRRLAAPAESSRHDGEARRDRA